MAITSLEIDRKSHWPVGWFLSAEMFLLFRLQPRHFGFSFGRSLPLPHLTLIINIITLTSSSANCKFVCMARVQEQKHKSGSHLRRDRHQEGWHPDWGDWADLVLTSTPSTYLTMEVHGLGLVLKGVPIEGPKTGDASKRISVQSWSAEQTREMTDCPEESLKSILLWFPWQMNPREPFIPFPYPRVFQLSLRAA